MVALANVTDNVSNSSIKQSIGEPNADSNDTLFSLLYDILEKLAQLDIINESVVAMKESVDKMETSSTNVQYVVNSIAGNTVSITAPTLQNVKSTLSANIDQNANDYIFTDPANGISYSVVNYDPITDELTLFMRQIIGEYKQSTGGTPYGVDVFYSDYRRCWCYARESGSIVSLTSGMRTDCFNWYAPDPNAYINQHLSLLENSGILANIVAMRNPTTTLYYDSVVNTAMASIPYNNRFLASGKLVSSYWCSNTRSTNGWSGSTNFSVPYFDLDLNVRTSTVYAYCDNDGGRQFRDEGLHGIAPIIVVKGNLGEIDYVKDLCTDWLKMSNTSLGSTGIEVFDTGYLLDVIGTEVGAVHTYKDSVHKYKHDLYVNTSENNLTSSVSNALLTGAAGDKFSIPYTSTMSTKTFTNEATLGTNHSKFVDVIIRDPSDKILYFGRIAKAKLGDNLITFTLPSDLQEDVPYLLQIFEESYYDHQGISTISTPVNARLVISND